ncbi:MAG: triple tyrosine motif-containing protein [Clostridium sp.]
MNEMIISTSLPSPQDKGSEIKINIENKIAEGLLYRFLIKCDGGSWQTIRDFNEEREAVWTPNEDGKYMIMVQSKMPESKKSHDFTSRIEFVIGCINEKLIKDIILSSSELRMGEKLEVTVVPNKLPLLCKYLIKKDGEWSLIRDYSLDTMLSFVPNVEGNVELLVECKTIDSENQFDDFETMSFKVLPMKFVRINALKCLTDDLILGKELTFEAEASYDESRVLLYKFEKIDERGNVHLIQDFSSKRLITFVEIIPGKYKLLCTIKDMYSHKKFDDRAKIHYEVVKYKPIKILSFTSDLSSPQIEKTPIEFKVICSGGDNLLYKFIIDGNLNESSSFSENNSYRWLPEASGMYKVMVLVKDKTCMDEYEEKGTLDFTIDKDFTRNIYIKEIELSNKKQVLLNEHLNVKVNATGGQNLLYEFIIRKDNSEVFHLDYDEADNMTFVPTEVGKHILEVRVKHPKSKRTYDVHSMISIDCKEFISAKIDYVLTEKKEAYVLGEDIELEVVTENTKDTLAKYCVEINGRFVEATEYSNNKKFKLVPRCEGVYTVKVYCKNILSTNDHDCKRELTFRVMEGPPITNAKIVLDNKGVKANENVTFKVQCDGGRDNLYEFYLMEQGEWKVIQKYSKKDYYGFMAFYKGYYKILALCKSGYSKEAYDDYDIIEVECN